MGYIVLINMQRIDLRVASFLTSCRTLNRLLNFSELHIFMCQCLIVKVKLMCIWHVAQCGEQTSVFERFADTH